MPANNQRYGALLYRLHFQRRADVDDGFGNVIPGAGDFTTAFTMDAAMRPRNGGETVMQARLQGRQPWIVTVRSCAPMKDVTTAWRLVDARNANRSFDINAAPVDQDGKGKWLDLLVTEGEPS